MLCRTMSAVTMLVIFLALTAPWPSPAQQTGGPGTDVYVNVTGGGAKKLNIAVPEFTVVAGTDTAGNAKLLASVIGSDLTFSGLFSVVAGTGQAVGAVFYGAGGVVGGVVGGVLGGVSALFGGPGYTYTPVNGYGGPFAAPFDEHGDDGSNEAAPDQRRLINTAKN